MLHMGDIARATQRYEESGSPSSEEADQSEDLISFAVPDVSLQQSLPYYADMEPGLHKAGEQHEEHPIAERNRMQSRHSSRRNAGIHSNPHHLPKTVVQSEVKTLNAQMDRTVLANISQAQLLLTRVISQLYQCL